MNDQPTLSNVTNPHFGKPPETQNILLQQLGAPHVSSFNYMMNEGLDSAVANLTPIEFAIKKDRICLQIEEVFLNSPLVPLGTIGVKNPRIFPTECRQKAATYKGKFSMRVKWFINGKEQTSFEKEMGYLPVMVKSNRCHLNFMSPQDLVDHGEHEQEWGGYFIVKGHERLVRMLIMSRRNYPMAIKRSGWKSKGALFSEFGVSMRCVANDQTVGDINLHYVTDGSAKLMFGHRKIPYYVPLMLILKSLCRYADQFIFQKLTKAYQDDSYYTECVRNMMRTLAMEGLKTHNECRAYLGKMFRVRFYELPDWYTDIEVADYILKTCIMIHLDDFEDKFDTLVFMTQKLFAFAQDKCLAESADSVMMQELLLGGHLYQRIIKEKLQYWLLSLKANIIRRSSGTNFTLSQKEIVAASKHCGMFENVFENFFATGNLSSQSGVGLSQVNGLTIVAENINRMRYMSHFRAVHRGAFFQEMRTTEVRQLLPDAWGFICPVHTPDGAPCGLLNHLTMDCMVTDMPDAQKVANITGVVAMLGVFPYRSMLTPDLKECYPVMVDGKMLGYVHDSDVNTLLYRLRQHKIKGEEVPDTLEIVFVPKKKARGQFPGLFLFTGPARMMRPLMNRVNKQVEFVGTFEQVYLDVCVTQEEFYPGVTTHMELSKSGMLSNLAKLIPMPDCNQSPRNMYQCQMGKQTMGTPCHNWRMQSETKLYRLQTPSTPLFRPVHHDNIGLDDFAMGTNAIVAVISYTGYDMEDAMIINKASDERGFAHGSIYKSEFIELDHHASYFCRDPERPDLASFLDTDGLPFIGRKINFGEPLYCYFSPDESRYIHKSFHGKEECFVDTVKLCRSLENRSKKLACITFRVPRNPSVGDKFASRAGQKGICSQKWPAEDLPFTETGLVPDIVFNPHGFPSRMTIAMMIEIMAGKSAAVHGFVHDATPFKFHEDDTAINYFGRLLVAGGYNYHGTETMYSGIDGRELKADIFFGIVHYQRLRHMVSDKWQVRSTGPNDIITRQPLKGRKRGGGVRFGEMERDSLISHGASMLLQDRLLNCSDRTVAIICTSCKSILGPITMVERASDYLTLADQEETCRLCGHGKNLAEIQIPYIFKFFVAQLASVNISIQLNCEKV